jgi:GPH family glycoside/pentoside/hexuronide:cation symporter
VATQQLPERLPRRVRLFYAAGSISGNALSQAFALWLIFFYAPPSGEDIPTQLPELGGLSPRVVLGLALALARVVESIDDPVVGYVTDRTSSRWGRRVPYILFATPWWVLGFFLLFVPPGGEMSILNLVWLIAVLEIYWLLSNFSGAPLEALLPHLARRHDDRVAIAYQQLLFGVGGAIVGLSLSSLLVEFVGFGAMAAVVAVIALVARYAALAGCWSHAVTDTTPSEGSFTQSVRDTLSNRQFVAFLPSFIGFRVGQLMLTALLPFYVSEVLGDVEVLGFTGADDKGIFTFALTALVIAGVIAGVPIFAPLALRAGKAAAFRISLLWGSAGLFLLFFAGFVPFLPQLLQAPPAIFVAGIPMAGVFMFPNILIADIVDDDARRTHTRREAMFYGTQNLLEKSATAFSPLIFALVLLAGDSSEDPLGIRLVGPVAGVLVLLGYFSFRNYSLQPDVLDRDAEAEARASG